MQEPNALRAPKPQVGKQHPPNGASGCKGWLSSQDPCGEMGLQLNP